MPPYGRERVPIEAFAFEQSPVPPSDASYLWGNPVFALAVLLGSSFNAQGRFDRDRFAFDLTELPLSFESTDEGGTRVKPSPRFCSAPGPPIASWGPASCPSSRFATATPSASPSSSRSPIRPHPWQSRDLGLSVAA